ncbi:1-deoxy-D-xylulose-5-phosphate reductoisomerase [Halothiobacillus diazotrophicus]|uniref:1-deoxy-D-xylulose 5-phosphate reductoisomerase n=1 Tax=Halothiobacillus diazotrophicus TaxID=1860122 RepID=A0A191ZJZ3_9GAMM|nr:1-deoxy-D-xylulose-5-phosphate reductoisomerase [Halothiobacillus diazotrophicus]ANJ68185.1 1-deoxy-D-xylulose-5-phosphate reductoisomerase [Halothiobacillus diazotrophicus]
MKKIAIFGSTGSIGASTLAVIERHPDRFTVETLVAHARIDVLLTQIRQFRPRQVGVADPVAADSLRRQLVQTEPDPSLRPEVIDEARALVELAAQDDVDVVVAAIVGTAGLASTWAAVSAGKQVLLANKESLVAAGALMMSAAERTGATIIPIDSEHNAIFQCLPVDTAPTKAVDKLILTASGGPFRTLPAAAFAEITPEAACRHPNWSMGRKISVDSATMMNKGLEVIEAAWLFGMPAARIDVLVHPESIVHSLVQFADGSVLAQMGHPDMRTPIAHALGWPDRIASGVGNLDLRAIGTLCFEAPDLDRFPCLRLAYEALEHGGVAPLTVNAANEIAVAAFLDGRLSFLQIPELIARTRDTVLEAADADYTQPASIADVLALDDRVRSVATATIARITGRGGRVTVGSKQQVV